MGFTFFLSFLETIFIFFLISKIVSKNDKKNVKNDKKM